MLTFDTKQTTTQRARLLRGLSDPSRIAILETLRSGPCSVSEIVSDTGFTQPNVSNHLGCMRGCGLVIAEPVGRSVIYRIRDDRILQLLDLVDDLLADHAAEFDTCPYDGSSKEGGYGSHP